MEKVRICTTHGKMFRRCGIEFGPDPIEVTIGDVRNIAKRVITAEDLAWIEQAAGPATREEIGPDGNTNLVPTGAVLRVEPAGRIRHGDTRHGETMAPHERAQLEREERAERERAELAARVAERDREKAELAERERAERERAEREERDEGTKGKPAKK